MHIAAGSGFTEEDQEEIVEIMLKHKANTKLMDKNGQTPLMIAIEMGKFKFWERN